MNYSTLFASNTKWCFAGEFYIFLVRYSIYKRPLHFYYCCPAHCVAETQYIELDLEENQKNLYHLRNKIKISSFLFFTKMTQTSDDNRDAHYTFYPLNYIFHNWGNSSWVSSIDTSKVLKSSIRDFTLHSHEWASVPTIVRVRTKFLTSLNCL